MRRTLLLVPGIVLLLGSATPVAAEEALLAVEDVPVVNEILGPPPPAPEAEAVTVPGASAAAEALVVEGVLEVGTSKSEATSSGSSAEGTALKVYGQEVRVGETTVTTPEIKEGSEASGNSSASGELVKVESEDVGLLVEVLPHEAATTETANSGTAQSAAALLHVLAKNPLTIEGLPGTLVELYLLHAQTQAAYTDDGTTKSGSSSAFSDIADLVLLDQRVQVLHTEAHSDGSSRSDLVVINGEAVPNPLGDQCGFTSEIADVGCLQAGSGAASAVTTVAPDLSEVPVAGEVQDAIQEQTDGTENLLPVSTGVSTGSAGSNPDGTATGETPATGTGPGTGGSGTGPGAEEPNQETEVLGIQASRTPASNGSLADTGGTPIGAAIGLLLLAAGLLLRRLRSSTA